MEGFSGGIGGMIENGDFCMSHDGEVDKTITPEQVAYDNAALLTVAALREAFLPGDRGRQMADVAEGLEAYQERTGASDEAMRGGIKIGLGNIASATSGKKEKKLGVTE